MFNRDPLFVPPAILPVTLRRGADRRRGIAALTTAVTTGLALADPRAARDRLEEELRGALQARSVRLRDDGAQPWDRRQKPCASTSHRRKATAVQGWRSSSTNRGRWTTGRVS